MAADGLELSAVQGEANGAAHLQAATVAAAKYANGQVTHTTEEDDFDVIPIDDAPSSLQHQQEVRKPWWKTFWLWLVVVGAAFVGLIALGISVGSRARSKGRHTADTIDRIAFSSCTQRNANENPVWQTAVVPAAPDAWVWLGDMAYMDMPEMDCSKEENQEHPDCNCAASFMSHPPGDCKSGDIQNARRKMDDIIRSDGYGAFLEFMCPGYLAAGAFPPDGADPSVCKRPIFGVYDDHDFGWNNGNGEQLADKNEIKQIYLDALGVPADSVRRNGARGIYEHRVLNQGAGGREIDLVLLDERYNRVPLPCHTRARFCRSSYADKDPFKAAWCADFLGSENVTDPGSCCAKDDEIALGWCRRDGSAQHPAFGSICLPAHPDFGATDWTIGDDGEPRAADGVSWDEVRDESGFCEVLGKKQRQWLNLTLSDMSAPLALIASGSVLFGQPQLNNDAPPHTGYCSGDDWDCYRPAQQNLIAQLSRLDACVVVLVGDYHHADIKRITPGDAGSALYHSPSYYIPQGMQLKRPIWQVMASGMDSSTASGPDKGCDKQCCGWQRDDAGLRGEGKLCNIFPDPNFGTVDVDWDRRVVQLTVLRGDGAGVATGADGQPIKVDVDLDTCEQLL